MTDRKSTTPDAQERRAAALRARLAKLAKGTPSDSPASPREITDDAARRARELAEDANEHDGA